MSFGITKTIPANQGIETIDKLYDGSITEYEFHMAGKPSKLSVGDYVYTIYGDMLYGRLQISQLQGGAFHPRSGKARTLIYVRAPGTRLGSPIAKKGHRGTRYYDGQDWPSES